MLFEKGNTFGKGRAPGYLNRRRVAEIVKDALGGKELIAEMLRLAGSNPKAQLEVMRDLLPYCYPKLAPAVDPQDEQTGTEETKKVASVVFVEELVRIRAEQKKTAESA